MIHLPDKDTIYFDVDDTLLLHGPLITDEEKCISVLDPPSWCQPDHPKREYYCVGQPHTNHIAKLKEHKAKGRVVVVWSQGGSDWAKQVVEALGLTEYVDLVVSKPCKYYDDLSSGRFMGNPSYLPIEGKR